LLFLIGVYFYISLESKIRVKQFTGGYSQSKSPVPLMFGNTFSSVPKEIRENLLEKLEAFEKSGLYLSKDLDMAQLAQDMDPSNTLILSTIVNHYKEMSFP